MLCLTAMNGRPPWQFRLSQLFGLTTLSAIAAAVAAARGPGTLFLSIGVMLAWLNWRGALEPLQSGQWQMILLGLAWNLFLLSLALPSMVIFSPVDGWEAAWLAFILPLNAIRRGDIFHLHLPWCVGNAVSNILMALVPLVMWRIRHGRGQWLTAALCLAMVFPWSVGWDTPMLPGYYVWCGGFYLALCALPIRAGTFAAMVALAALLGVAAEWD